MINLKQQQLFIVLIVPSPQGLEKLENRSFLENGLERLDFNFFFSVQAGKAGKVTYICKTLVYCFRFSVSV